MLQKIDQINITTSAANEETADIVPFELSCPDAAQTYWHLVTNDKLVAELTEDELGNVVSGLMATTKQVCDQLKAIGNKVRLVSRFPQDDFDICDSLTAQGFTVSVNTFGDEHQSWANYLLEHYTAYKSKEELSENLLTVCEHISWFKNAFEREQTAKDIASKFKIQKATIVSQINQFISVREKDVVQELTEDENALPSWMTAEQRDFFYNHGWVSRLDNITNTGIYFSSSNGPKRLTNFVLIPLVHIYTKDEMGNRRLTELNNGMLKPVIELPGKAFTSMEQFDTIITSEGNFFTYDGFTKSHLNKIKSYYLGEYPKCFELNTLGWQPEGFFSFSNLIYKNELVEYNNYGFAQIGDHNYLSMGASNALEGVRQDDDIYKNDKYLCYIKPEISFERWCELMVQVYPEHGMMAIAFVMMTIFRDILFKRNNNFPLLYPYGPVGSGKSQFGASICNFFTHGMPMFNLANGTDYAFFSQLGRFINVAIGLNEFDENTIKEEWFRAIKGAYDGEGREKGTGKRNKTTSQAINVAIVLIGQFLSTKDDNSALSRTIPCKITEDSNRTAEKIALYDELKQHEQKGLSGLICTLLEHRQYVADHFLQRFNSVSSALKSDFAKEGIQPKNRIMENYTTALAMVSVMGERLNLGFVYQTFFDHCKKEIGKMSSIMSESNSLSQFWKTVEFLLDQGVIQQGNHFRVEACNEVRILVDRKTVQNKKFETPKKLMFLRLGTIHMLYMSEIRRQTGKAGQNEQTIITYMKDQESYIGSNPSSKFINDKGETTNTSSYVFDYDLLGANLERYKDDATKTVTITGKVTKDAVVENIIGTEKLNFTIIDDQSYHNDGGQAVKNEVYTQCLSTELHQCQHLTRGRELKLTGTLNEHRAGDRVIRRMAVTQIEFLEAVLPFEKSEDEVSEMFGEAGK